MTKVSVIVPIYGVEKYIEQCAESLFAQTYRNIEYIFIDDCSPDRSLDILQAAIDRHADRKPQIKIIRNAQNSGIGIVRQKGIEAAEGEYITFVDSDDFIPANAIQKLVEKTQPGNFDIVEGTYRKIGCRHEKNVLPQHISSKKRLQRILCHKGNGFLWAKLFRRSLFVDNDIKFTGEINFSEDFSVIPCLLFEGSRTWTDELVYNYRCNNQNSYTHRISFKDFISQAKSNAAVKRYIMTHDKRGTYHSALFLGMLTIYRDAHRHNIPLSDFNTIDKIIDYHSDSLLDRLFFRLFHSSIPPSIPDKLFSVYRKLYIYSRLR